MARTAQTNLKLQNSGTPLTTGGFGTLNLRNNISASDGGSGVAIVDATGGASGTNITVETVTAVQSGANITLDLTTLAHTFVAIEVVFRNGQAATPTTDWTRSTNTITVTNANASEVFQIQYTY